MSIPKSKPPVEKRVTRAKRKRLEPDSPLAKKRKTPAEWAAERAARNAFAIWQPTALLAYQEPPHERDGEARGRLYEVLPVMHRPGCFDCEIHVLDTPMSDDALAVFADHQHTTLPVAPMSTHAAVKHVETIARPGGRWVLVPSLVLVRSTPDPTRALVVSLGSYSDGWRIVTRDDALPSTHPIAVEHRHAEWGSYHELAALMALAESITFEQHLFRAAECACTQPQPSRDASWIPDLPDLPSIPDLPAIPEMPSMFGDDDYEDA